MSDSGIILIKTFNMACKIGKHASTNPSPNDGYVLLEDAGVPTLSFPDTLALIGFDIENTTTLEQIDLSNLISCDPNNVTEPDHGTLYFGANGALTSIDLSALEVSSGLFVVNNPLITSVILTNLIDISDTARVFRIDHNASLVNLSLPSFVPLPGMVYNFVNNALSAASVNGLLAKFVANAAFTSGDIHFEGGTNSAPTGQGIVDRATLASRSPGVNVTTN